jgi:anhydro-N-acetylmuramic acid kinase
MHQLERLRRRTTKLVAGLMSGTSADGLDVALVQITGSGTSTRIRQIAFETIPLPGGYKEHLLKNSVSSTANLDEVVRLDMWFAGFCADAVKRIARRARVPMNRIDLIGSHGQTIRHCPEAALLFGRKVRSTLQIGNPSAIAAITGIVTVGDFRSADIAAGGSGAPLVPLFDFLMLRSDKVNRAALNIGGIANITILPKACKINQVRAFDTGPGNMLIDALMSRLYHSPCDKGGKIAKSGRIHLPLLRFLLRHPFLKQPPPKSTGREAFGGGYIDTILGKFGQIEKRDLIATATEFTALSIYDACLRYVPRRIRPEEIIVSGGGVHNGALMEALESYFAHSRIIPAGSSGIDPDAKEAVCFALLANETVAGHPGNIPGATGAKRPVVLGSIAVP